MMFDLALVLALLIGLSLGLLGSGGSIITLPVLVYVARIPAQQAVGMSLVIVGGASLLGAVLNLRRQAFDWRAALFFALSGMAGAFFGAKFTHLVSAAVLLLIFGALMLVVASRMLGKREIKPVFTECHPIRCLAAGVAVGFLTGFLGVGGGFLILPALVFFAGLEMKTAIGTSLAIIAANCVAGLIGQMRYMHFNWGWTAGFLGVALAGMIMGTMLAKRLPASVLRRGFAWCVLVLGVVLIGWNLSLVVHFH